jgi:hypothetical protein
MLILNFIDIAGQAGFAPGPDGKLNLPATQETADRLAAAAVALLPSWKPGDAPVDAVLSGAGPVWGYLTIAHALHGRVRALHYSSPNAPIITVFNHGA